LGGTADFVARQLVANQLHHCAKVERIDKTKFISLLRLNTGESEISFVCLFGKATYDTSTKNAEPCNAGSSICFMFLQLCPKVWFRVKVMLSRPLSQSWCRLKLLGHPCPLLPAMFSRTILPARLLTIRTSLKFPPSPHPSHSKRLAFS
jgi:hypothetical protein